MEWGGWSWGREEKEKGGEESEVSVFPVEVEVDELERGEISSSEEIEKERRMP